MHSHFFPPSSVCACVVDDFLRGFYTGILYNLKCFEGRENNVLKWPQAYMIDLPVAKGKGRLLVALLIRAVIPVTNPQGGIVWHQVDIKIRRGMLLEQRCAGTAMLRFHPSFFKYSPIAIHGYFFFLLASVVFSRWISVSVLADSRFVCV